MGKPDRRNHRTSCDGRSRNLDDYTKCRNGSISGLSCLKELSLQNWGHNSCCRELEGDGNLMGPFVRNVKSDLVNVNGKPDEAWLLIRVLKPSGPHSGSGKFEDRETTPTPENCASSPGGNDSRSVTPTPEGHHKEINGDIEVHKVSNGDCEINDTDREFGKLDRKTELLNSSGDNCGNTRCEGRKGDKFGNHSLKENKDLSETELRNIHELIIKLDEIKENGCVNDARQCNGVIANGQSSGQDTPTSVPDTPTSVLYTPISAMDNASLNSFDHFDFDTSFCSLKSTDTMMEQGDLADQLSLVQQMVMEMKTGFVNAMEELSKIQYGDQNLQQQLADNKKECHDEIKDVITSMDELKVEFQRLNSQVQEISEAQRTLQDKVESYQSDKSILLEELERNGVISDHTRFRLSGGSSRETNNNLPEIGPMVHPYLNSLQHHHQRGREEMYHSDSSLTAAVSRSLNLTQALGEKCLNLDFSTTSSDDEDNSRHSHSGSGHNKPIRRHRSFQIDEGNRNKQKVAPHDQLLEEVHREESARDIVEAEREYCAQIWSLLEDYMNPIREEEIIGKREFHLLFPVYIPQIYEQHCIMLRKLEDRIKKWKYTGVIGDVFAKFTEAQEGEGLCLYKDFINDFPTIIGTMNKWFTHSPHFRELMQSQCLANSTVLQLLLAPLQQVPKYSLLLKGLLRYTPPDHPDRYYLESSLNRLKHFLNEMNDDLEHAMQVINSSNQPIVRPPREFGHSGHSKSSGSSGDANHLSRDSGIHSNEEEREKSPMSPNSTRRHLLQVLREKREQEIYQSRRKQDGHPPTPKARKELDYGSHPDLSHHQQGYQDGRMSPFLASLPQSKMFSSLSKLPLPKDRNKVSRSMRGPESQKPPINTNYLRPLTPQVFPTSTSAHNFESARRREELAGRAQRRPASAVEFAYSGHGDSNDRLYDFIAQQGSLTVSPPHSSSSDKSRRDLQLSLQKLLVETNNAADYSDNDGDEQKHVNQVSSYHKQFLATKDRILQHHGDSYYDNTPDDSVPVDKEEDYGIYGDDDDDGNDNTTERVHPMRLLPDPHRPKIMVPKWRQNASPHPPSYNHTVENLNKPKHNYSSEENLAASLAQSLLDGRSTAGSTLNENHVTDGKEQKADMFNRNGAGSPAGTNSLKRRLKNSETPKQPKASVGEPRRSLSDKPNTNAGKMGTRGSSDKSAIRPTDLNINHKTPTSDASHDSDQNAHTDESNKAMCRPKSVTKLSDVIAYTADCLEKSEASLSASDTDSVPVDGPVRPASFTIADSSKHEHNKKLFLDDAMINMKVSSVDGDSDDLLEGNASSASHPIPNEKPNGEFKIAFAVSPTSVPVSKSPVNTDGIVNYFQNKTQGKTESTTETSEKASRMPTFINMNKTSTPVSENPFHLNVSKSKDSFPGFSKRESARLVRGDNVTDENKDGGSREKEQPALTKVETEGATKESVLRAVDKLRSDLERQKQNHEVRKQSKSISLTPSSSVEPSSPTSPTSPTPNNIQKHFNELSKYSKDTDGKPLTLKTFSSIPNRAKEQKEDADTSSSDLEAKSPSDQSDQRQGIYRKAGHLKVPSKLQTDSSPSARQIQRLERSVSPSGRPASPSSTPNEYEKFKSQVESSNISKPQKRGSSPHRGIKGVFGPTRSKSPSIATATKERPKSVAALPNRNRYEENGETVPLKSAMKDTKIPVLKKSGSAGNPLSKSSEDISKLKKKSAFKDQLKHIFGRKKKKSKSYSAPYDPDEAYNNHVTLDPEPSFKNVNDTLFPLTPERRSNSTSQILQCYMFEDEDDYSDEPISAV